MLPAVAAAKEVRARLVVLVQSGEVLRHLLGPPVVLVVLVAEDFNRVGSVNSAWNFSAAVPSAMHHGQNTSSSLSSAKTGPL